MANFLDELASGSRRTWRDLCSRETPQLGSDQLLIGPWREAICAAVACEKTGRAGHFADGPAGQVVDYLMEKGFTKYQRAAEATEAAAHEGRIRPAGGTGSASAAIDAWAGSSAPHVEKPLCPHGKKCYRKNPEHMKEYAHPWQEGGSPSACGGSSPPKVKDGWSCPACTLINKLSSARCEACGGSAPPGASKVSSENQTLQIMCGHCSNVCTVAVPAGTMPGATVQAKCPHCGTTNQANMPGSVPSALTSHTAPRVGGVPPPPSGRRRALLVGVNYFGTRAELRGCINDVHNLHRLLIETFHWRDGDIRTLTDDGRGGGMPTRRNIEQGLLWLTSGASPGDVLFFSFSGHGAQQEDPHGYEEDGMNETILPVDFEHAGMITDDQIGDFIVKPLPEGVRLTSVMDCCHSGTGLDLPFTWDQRRGMWREEVNPFHSRGDVLMFSGCEDDDTSSDASSCYTAPGGAMTTAFCDVLRRNPHPTYPQLLDLLHRSLASRGFSQRPVLSASQCFSFERPFAFDDVHPNMNSSIGRIFRQKFPPRPRPMGGPLADMLGPLGMLAGGLILGAVAGDVLGGMGEMLFGGF